MKTEAQLARTEMELRAVDAAQSDLRYLGYGPQHDTWKGHCQAFDDHLHDALARGEFWMNNPDHKFG